jgi:hypothetical protein
MLMVTAATEKNGKQEWELETSGVGWCVKFLKWDTRKTSIKSMMFE